jgi:imidazolonepropionase-like amidohydrolase
MIKRVLLSLCLMLFVGMAMAQVTYPRNGIYDERQQLYAFTNATIFVDFDTKIENATLVIRAGKVEQVGANVSIPKGAITFDLKGKYIYPSFIDAFSNYGMPKPKAEGQRPRRQPQMLSNKKGAYGWNEALKPEFKAHEAFLMDKKKAKELRELGFGAVLSHRMDGISRGSGTVVSLAEGRENELILNSVASNHFSFRKGTSTQSYPSSLMGCIALLRQTYYDADWYKRVGHEEETNISLQSWNDLASVPQIFDASDKLNALRADKVGDEFKVQYIIKGNGDEYQRINELKKTGAAFIIPINFPAAYDVEDPYDAVLTDLDAMLHWELAAANTGKLSKAGIEFAITMQGTKSKDFLTNLRKAVKEGLSESAALKALTATPAKMSGVSDKVGALKAGMVANFIISSDNIFGKKAKIHHNWVQGKGYVLKKLDQKDIRGSYTLNLDGKSYTLDIEGKTAAVTKAFIPMTDSTKVEVKHKLEGNAITLSFNLDGKKSKVTTLSGSAKGKSWTGNGTTPDGSWFVWSATKTKDFEEKPAKKDKKDKKKEDETVDRKGNLVYPFLPFGNEKLPTAQTYLIKNATVWTNEKDGILENTDVLIENGKIAKVGKNLTASGVTEIDGTGKHLTSGIIDEHSHIAISRGVNEGTQSSSAEVSISDVVNSENIHIYRQLSGGVTTAQLLHGSANPIGGQSALIKLKWGYAPEEMKYKGNDPFIKFALGENVKQSNWGDNNRTRFPQSRMGVEQVFDDHFTRARQYEAAMSANPAKTRRDLELDVILQIINKERFITCHSYVQSEINMLMKIAEKHSFRINTFTHILEGYKVADKMVKHGAGGSTFSDWWAYKYEVIDAIPYNGAIMHEQGVVTAFNSDDAEMARRLNQEAGKAVMYGNVSQEDALKFVTLNPAKLLHIDDKVGSIKVGKDADVVLWTANPLSIYAKAEFTFIEGIKFFDRAEDLKKREVVKAERARLIQKMIAAKKGGAKTQPVKVKSKKHYHCDTVHDEMK